MADNKTGPSLYDLALQDALNNPPPMSGKNPSSSSQSLADAAPTSDQGFFGDMADAFQMGVGQAAAGDLETIHQLTGSEGVARARDAVQNWSDGQVDQMSQPGQEAMRKQFFSDDENGNTQFGDAWTDPRAMAQQLSNVSGQFAAQIVTGLGFTGVVGKIGAKTVAKTLIESKVKKGIAPEIAAAQTRDTIRQGAGATGQALAGAMTAGGQMGIQVRDEIMNLSSAELDESQAYLVAYQTAKLANPDASIPQLRRTARIALANQVATAVQADPLTITANLTLDAIGGRYIDKLIQGVGTGRRATNALMQAGAQGATNAVQGGAEQLNMNRAMINEDVKPDMNAMEGVATNALNEGFAGGVIGGVAGGALPGEARADTGGNPGVPLGGDTQTEGLGQPVVGGGQPQAPQQVQEGGTIQPGPSLSLQEAAEQIKAERGQYRGIDDDIRIAEEQGFDDEAVRLRAAKRNFEMAADFANEGDTESAKRFNERALKIYREVTGMNDPAMQSNTDQPMNLPAEYVAVGEFIQKSEFPAETSPRRGETIDQTVTPEVSKDIRPGLTDQSYRGIPPTVDAPFYMPPTDESQLAKARTEAAFTQQQGDQPDIQPERMNPADVQFIPNEDITIDQMPPPLLPEVEELPGVAQVDELPPIPDVQELPPIPEVRQGNTLDDSDRDAIRNHRMPKGLDDGRILRDWHRGRLQSMASELHERGGVAYLTDEHGKGVGRTKSLNDKWFQNAPDNVKRIGVRGYKLAIEKALAGRDLKPIEARAVDYALGVITEARNDYARTTARPERDELVKFRKVMRGEMTAQEAGFVDMPEISQRNYIPESVRRIASRAEPRFTDESYGGVDGIDGVGMALADDIHQALESGIPESVVTKIVMELGDDPVDLALWLGQIIEAKNNGQEITSADVERIAARRAMENEAAERGDLPEGLFGRPEPEPEPEPVLTSYTEDDIRQREAEARQRESEKAKAEQKATADAMANDFLLTGSNSEADQAAARGQGDLLGAAPARKAEPKPAPEKKASAEKPNLPDILSTPRKTYLNRMAKDAGIKRGSPGYDAAMQRIEEQYDTDVDKAQAGLSFEQFNELNSDSPESINRQAWESLREEYGIEGQEKPVILNYANKPFSTKAAATKALKKHPGYELSAVEGGFELRPIPEGAATSATGNIENAPRAPKTDVNDDFGVDGNEPDVLAMVAYHGTPHEFDRFSLDAIGTGEGAQAYGWGLYFAGKKEIAEWYQKELSARRVRTKNGEFNVAEIMRSLYETERMALALVTSFGGDFTKARSEAIKRGEDREYLDALDYLEREVEFLNLDGNLYRADIPEESELLDWDKPISEQPESISKPLLKWRKDNGDSFNYGEEAYRAIESHLRRNGSSNPARDASMMLNEMGIPGLKYLDGSNRNSSSLVITYNGKDLKAGPGMKDYSDKEMAALYVGGYGRSEAKQMLRYDKYDGAVEFVDQIKDSEISTRDDATRNYVIWDEDRVTIEAVNDQLRQAEVLAMFAGETATTANLDNLQQAKKLRDSGDSMETIRRNTGWNLGVDGKWRYEISDDQASLVDNYAELIEQRTTVGEILNHEPLYKAYPFIRNIYLTKLNAAMKEDGVGGVYYEGNNRMEVDPDKGKDEVLSMLLHEIQHAIQGIENFGRGGMSDERFAKRVKNAVSRMSDESFFRAGVVADVNAGLTRKSLESSEVARNALKYESVQRLMDYANRDKPSSVFRLIRNELQWIYHEDFRENDRAKELERMFYDIPKRGVKRNQVIRDIAAEAAQVIRDSIPREQYRSFRDDPRTTKGMINALQREASRDRKALRPIDEANREKQATKYLDEQTRYKTPFQVYKALAGEIEARTTQARQNLTEEQRRDRPPRSDMDVPPEEAIVIMGGMELAIPQIASSAAPKGRATTVKSWLNNISSDSDQMTIVATADELPSHIKTGLGDKYRNADGAYDVKTGKSYIVAGNIRDEAHAKRVYLHEVVGHGGVISYLKANEKKLGRTLMATLDEIFSELGKDEINQAIGRYGFDYSSQKDKREAVLEYIAHKAERGERMGLVRRVVAMIRDAIRTLWPDIGWSDTDTLALIEKGRRYLQKNGTSENGMDGVLARMSDNFNIAERAAPLRSKARDLLDAIRFQTQDKLIDLKNRQRGIDDLDDSANAYQKAAIWEGRAGERINDFDEEHVQPLLEKVAESGLNLSDVGEWLVARHAREANEYLAEINPDKPDSERYRLSGMSNDEADAILSRHSGNAALDEVGSMIDRINTNRVDMLIKEGLITEDMAGAWRSRYQNYVPLNREEAEGSDYLPPRGQGFQIKGKESKMRTGSAYWKPDKIISHVIANFETSIIRAEKNKVGEALLKFVEENPDEGFWSIDTERKQTAVRNGKVIETGKGQLADNELGVKRNGVDHVIVFNRGNEQAARLARGLKNLQAAEMNTVMRTMAKATRFLAMINTSFNPEFMVTNFFRDVQTAAYNLSDTKISSMQKQVLKDILPAGNGIRKALFGNGEGEWAELWEDFRKNGGKTGWIDLHSDIKEKEQDLMKAVERIRDGKPTKGNLKRMLDAIDNSNTVVENGVRLAAYKAALDAGLSKEKAAALAKDLTVNFNRKGAMGPQLNAVYMFFNAAVQGNVRLLQAMVNSKKGRALAYGTIGFAVMLDMFNRSVAGDDDDGENLYDSLPDYVKERNIIIMGEKEPLIKIPAPWGYNVLHVIGQEIGRGVTGERFNALDSAGRVAMAFASSFNPLSSGSVSQMLSPTIADPVVMIAENKNFSGNPLMPEHTYDSRAPRPEYQMHFSTARDFSKFSAEFLNDISGGNEVRPGSINISPEVFDLLIDTLTGGVGRLASNTGDTLGKLVTGEDIEAENVPFLRQVHGFNNDYSIKARYYEWSLDAAYAKAEAAKLTGRELAEVRTSPAYRMVGIYNATERKLRALRKQRRAMEQKNATKEQLEKMDQMIRQEMARFNRQYIRVVLGGEG